MSTLNYEFKVMSYERTHANHVDRIAKVIKSGFKFRHPKKFEVVHLVMRQLNESHVMLGYVAGMTDKQQLRWVKQNVNWIMRTKIRKQLLMTGLPQSWDTAVYIMHYGIINRFMAEEAKFLITNSLKRP